MKIVIIITIIGICFFITVCKTENIKKHTVAIRQCVMMIDNIEIMLNYHNSTIEKMIESLLLSNNYKLLSFLPHIYDSLSDNKFNAEVFTKNNLDLFDNEDISFIKGFFSNLGKSDVQGQLSNCKLYKEFFKTKLAELEKSEKINCKTISVMVMGIGFAVSILIL